MPLRAALVVALVVLGGRARVPTPREARTASSPGNATSTLLRFVQDVLRLHLQEVGLLVVSWPGSERGGRRPDSPADYGPDSDPGFFRDLSRSGHHSLLLLSGAGTRQGRGSRVAVPERARGYLLFSNTLDGLLHDMSALAEGSHWNATARFLLALSSATDSGVAELHTLFSLSRAMSVMNLVLGVPRGAPSESGVRVDVFTSFPYRNASGVCGMADLGLVSLDSWSPTDHRFLRGVPLFPDKSPGLKMGGCVVRVVGSDGLLQRRLIDEMAAYLDVQVLLTSHQYAKGVDIHPVDGKWGGFLGELQGGHGDLALFMLLTPDRVLYFHTTQPFVAVRVEVVLRCPNPHVEVRYEFLEKSWLHALLGLTMAAYFTIAFGAFHVAELRGDAPLTPRPHVGRGLYEFWSVLMENPVQLTFMPQRFRPVCLLMAFGLFVSNGLVKSSITAELSSSRSADLVTRLAQIRPRGIEVGFPAPIILDNVQKAAAGSAVMTGFFRQSHSCAANLTQCLKRFRSDTTSRYGLAATRLGNYSRLLSDLGVCMFPVQEPIELAPVVLLTRRGDPLGPRLAGFLSRLHAAGLPYLWLHQLTPQLYPERAAARGRGIAPGSAASSSSASEAWRQVVIAMRCGAVGLAAAGLVFLWERMSVEPLEGYPAGRR